MVAFPPNSRLAEVWEQIRAWPAAERILLASKIAESLNTCPDQIPPSHSPPKPTGNVADIIGLWRDVEPKPTDEELERILEDSIFEKHG